MNSAIFKTGITQTREFYETDAITSIYTTYDDSNSDIYEYFNNSDIPSLENNIKYRIADNYMIAQNFYEI